jgi:hypothetical protein
MNNKAIITVSTKNSKNIIEITIKYFNIKIKHSIQYHNWF